MNHHPLLNNAPEQGNAASQVFFPAPEIAKSKSTKPRSHSCLKANFGVGDVQIRGGDQKIPYFTRSYLLQSVATQKSHGSWHEVYRHKSGAAGAKMRCVGRKIKLRGTKPYEVPHKHRLIRESARSGRKEAVHTLSLKYTPIEEAHKIERCETESMKVQKKRQALLCAH